MSLKRISHLPAFSGVAASQTATVDLPVGPRYHVVWLVYDNTANDGWTDSNVCSEIRVKVNGKVQRVFTPAQLNSLNSMFHDPGATWGTAGTTPYGTYDNSTGESWIPIFLAEPWRPAAKRDDFAWATGDVQTFQIEVVLGSATGPVLRAFAEVDNAVVTVDGLQKRRPIGLITKWNRFGIPVTGGSVVNYQQIPRKDVALQLSIWGDGTRYVTDAQLLADGYEWRNGSDEDFGVVYRARGMNPTAIGVSDRVDIILDYDDLPPGGGLRLDGIQDLRLNLTIGGTGSGQLTTILQTLGRPD